MIIVSGQGDKQNALRAVGAGAYDFLCKPVDMDELRLVLQRCIYVAELEQEYRAMQQDRRADVFEDMLGASPQMQAVFNFIRKVAPTTRAGLDSRRERHRQGNGGAGAPPPERAGNGRLSPSTATRSRKTCSRASFSAMKRAPSPAPTRSAKGTSSRPPAARSFSTKSANCRRRSR